MTILFILFIWNNGEPSPITAFVNQDDCWLAVEDLLADGESADCRTFTSPSLVGPEFTYAPETSPRPKPRPANLTGNE